MLLKKFKPVTPSLRALIQVDRSHLWKGDPVKKFVVGLSSSGGRNNMGRITVYHRGGGHKKKYRFIDYKRTNDLPGKIARLEYDPNRTSFIALVEYENGTSSYILAPHGLKLGDNILSGISSEIDSSVGNCMPLKYIPVGSMVHNIEYIPGKGGQVVRSAGTYAQLIRKDDTGFCLIRLPSGEDRLFPDMSKATVGILSNLDHKNIVIAKAGRSRWLGRRPIVRGVAMNPIDHPHGGGEGKTSGGRPSVTPWAWPTKGQPTRSKRKHNSLIVQRAKKRV
jgi:large subunit ribosomal protein L2